MKYDCVKIITCQQKKRYPRAYLAYPKGEGISKNPCFLEREIQFPEISE